MHKGVCDFFIKNFTHKDDIVLDPFMGCGTTGLCCYQQERNYIGFEISEEYCEIDGQKNAFLLSKKEAERVAEMLQKAIKGKKSDIVINIEEAKGNDEEISEINIEEAKDNDEEIIEIYILIVDITSRVKKKVSKKIEMIMLNEKSLKINMKNYIKIC